MGELAMTRHLTAIIEREGDGYVALCPALDIASQGDSVAEARDNLKEALELFFETASDTEVERRLRGEVYITQVEVSVG
jgi:predicted RNase H-like HicB family nuclease